MMVVLDTNILASGLVASGGPLKTIMDAWVAGQYEVVISSDILAELAQTLEKRYFADKLSGDVRQGYVREVAARAIVVSASAVVAGVATHPEDDRVLATAVSGAADYLVTGDKQMQKLGSYQGVTVMSPTDFAALLATLP